MELEDRSLRGQFLRRIVDIDTIYHANERAAEPMAPNKGAIEIAEEGNTPRHVRLGRKDFLDVATACRDLRAPRGGIVIELDLRALAPTALCDELVHNRATALLLLVGHPEPAVSIVTAVRHDQRLAEIMIGAPAGQPEFAEWATLLGDDSAAIPFLRYLPEHLSPLGARVETALRERPGEAPSFVATAARAGPSVAAEPGRVRFRPLERTVPGATRTSVFGMSSGFICGPAVTDRLTRGTRRRSDRE
jgi:hypothetical protein